MSGTNVLLFDWSTHTDISFFMHEMFFISSNVATKSSQYISHLFMVVKFPYLIFTNRSSIVYRLNI